MDRRQRLIEIFEDTQRFYAQNARLAVAVQASKAATKLYEPEDCPGELTAKGLDASVTVTRQKTFEAAMSIHADHPEWKIAVLNFASATNPGGGVKTGSSAQEESLCRCSTLYPALTQDWLWQKYYQKNRDAHDNLHTDACIYTPGVIICKTDAAYPERMAEEDWVTVDVISCAAPNLRKRPGNLHNPEYGTAKVLNRDELYQLHVKRAKQILRVAAGNNVDALVLGAFGCGAFENDPNTVAKAYADVLPEYKQYFRLVEFAVYCRPEEAENYDAFQRTLE
ncbi:MAG: TIGR02452 family protein [Oscillospiraceae bacterium]|nr:TIGR02452 family protein [Oscillospiraceae bacterium]